MGFVPSVDPNEEGCSLHHVVVKVGKYELEYDLYAHNESEAEVLALERTVINFSQRRRRNNGRKKNVRQDDSIIR